MPSTSDVTFLYIGNFAEMDTDEGDFDSENPNVVLGVHDSLAFVDVTQYDQDDNDQIGDNETGSADTLTYDTGGGAITVSQDNTSVYDAEVLLGDGSTVTTQLLVIQAVNGDVFIGEIYSGSLDNQAIQSIELLSEFGSNYAGTFEGAASIDNATVVCYAPGTLIATAQGDVAVETLKPGDMVETQDHGFQPIRWIHQSDQPLDGAAQDARPVLIRAGALGANRPAQDLIVSPNHRILVGGGAQLQDRFQAEAFAPAKALTSLPGIRFMCGKKHMTWVHFACDRHEVVRANGCQSESLLLGPMVIAGLSVTKRRTLAELFLNDPAQDMPLNGPPARECLTVGATRRQLKTKSHKAVRSQPMAEASTS